MTEDGSISPYYCKWCEAVIVIDGELATEEEEAYWHAYDHRDKGKYAVDVLDSFKKLDTVETDQHLVNNGT